MGPKWAQLYKRTNKYRLNIIYGFAQKRPLSLYKLHSKS